MNNSLAIAVMSGGMLQQGTTDSTQSATDSFNSVDVGKALEAFAAALKVPLRATFQPAWHAARTTADYSGWRRQRHALPQRSRRTKEGTTQSARPQRPPRVLPGGWRLPRETPGKSGMRGAMPAGDLHRHFTVSQAENDRQRNDPVLPHATAAPLPRNERRHADSGYGSGNRWAGSPAKAILRTGGATDPVVGRDP